MNAMSGKQRRNRTLFLSITVLFICSLVVNIVFWIQQGRITCLSIRGAQQVAGLEFTRHERKMMLENLRENLESYEAIEQLNLDNGVAPAVEFDPVLPFMDIPVKEAMFKPSDIAGVSLPAHREDLAFFPVTKLAWLISHRKITSTELTKLYIERLKTYGPKLRCVVTLMEETAIEEARQADREIARGIYRGPLHGIPYGVKDLLATKDAGTAWGAAPYKGQQIPYDASVIVSLREAGAVLVAKLSLGALAMGDVWYGGKTLNPWNPEQGSSGSSAGPASATAAGLVGFSIGTETWGSIVSPSTRCRVTGLRPTFGRVSRYGAMALSWSMDKIGPICRSAEDCALVFNAVYGPDGRDTSVRDYAFSWDASADVRDLRVGWFGSAFESDTANWAEYEEVHKIFSRIGVTLVPFNMPDFPVYSLSFILSAEAAAAFDGLTRSGRDDLLVRQDKNAWPNIFRQSRFIPAVEYIQANRARRLLMEDMYNAMKDLDAVITPSFGKSILLCTNLTGHPAVVLPLNPDAKGNSLSISIIGRLFQEGKALLIAKAFQDATDFHAKAPDLSEFK